MRWLPRSETMSRPQESSAKPVGCLKSLSALQER